MTPQQVEGSSPAVDQPVQWALYMATEGCQRSNTKTVWKNPLVPLINHYWWSLLSEDFDNWCLTINHVSSFKNTKRITLIDKRHRKNCKPTQSNPDKISKLQPCLPACLYCFALVRPECASNQHGPPLSSYLFMKPSHNDNIHMHLNTQSIIKHIMLPQAIIM